MDKNNNETSVKQLTYTKMGNKWFNNLQQYKKTRESKEIADYDS